MDKKSFKGYLYLLPSIIIMVCFTLYPLARAIIMSFLGVGVVAVPTGIISAGFVEHYNRESYKNNMIDIEHIGEVKVDKVIKQNWPFIIILIVDLFLFTYVPQLINFLPNLILGPV